MKIDRFNPLLLITTLASLVAVCRAEEEDAVEEESWFETFLNNEFFQKLYDLLPGIEQQWLVLLIFGGGAMVALIILLWILKCICCGGKPNKPVVVPRAEFSKGTATPSVGSLNATVDTDVLPPPPPQKFDTRDVPMAAPSEPSFKGSSTPFAGYYTSDSSV
mmetsp:Transcript_14231/g.21709  ORF Transcript_14231/g.21709 Transcript_14231/m.21709 type:complete len:162 (+) Transcript_14231:64-549(+)|eukprot:CAMPEP_0178920026 /NCGR_PEP_ID=MMETSP0786-20121207/14772_1 /TAXON_ID=186022 /ORGANISM="Thalassionema frauenfeldii, Strain CCMP 1798" /LENGTH=161 /DNA_ID=CAMNT_0020594039 /DNA_START=42 /DNA_END=527 /DNA_ORIENTATION=+